MKNRLDWGVVFALSEYAKRLLRQNEIPSDLSQRELEILASAKVCERCGAVYSIHDEITGECPCCVELSERVDRLASTVERAEFREGRLVERLKSLTDKNEILKSKLENIKTIIETKEEE